jgi:hypothetical protein
MRSRGSPRALLGEGPPHQMGGASKEGEGQLMLGISTQRGTL